ncbi:hypothetical protein [Streptomyces albireticuli]|uniref:Uncharacterized protein n=1 Tax=Streptomyces albireticuli TaxID=1940 RepID=A0A2A2DH78_9ACTN|nr:hypothetical protein [Streptomyces albireticuli]MCD9146140.1 hypothetical protein [Streptomyces albireticuli]MCD9166190.1 hypothetical protein [Streptomyces albireticuli]MCD9196517.1 hypothetical protein [Streptomyces albireticuli]PAU50894.1 hypothetical protein CK936_00085 [Streptomyces albireticuli]
MRMNTDDEVYAADDLFLGPPRMTLPWRVRYRAYGIGTVLYALVLLLELWTGVLGPWPAVYGLVFVMWATMRVMDRVDHEHTARAVAVTFWHEVSAPRPSQKTGARARLTLSGVRRRAPRTR